MNEYTINEEITQCKVVIHKYHDVSKMKMSQPLPSVLETEANNKVVSNNFLKLNSTMSCVTVDEGNSLRHSRKTIQRTNGVSLEYTDYSTMMDINWLDNLSATR